MTGGVKKKKEKKLAASDSRGMLSAVLLLLMLMAPLPLKHRKRLFRGGRGMNRTTLSEWTGDVG
jgi:hypothetical protein